MNGALVAGPYRIIVCPPPGNFAKLFYSNDKLSHRTDTWDELTLCLSPIFHMLSVCLSMSQFPKSPTVHLPPEVLLQILSYIPYQPSSQNILYNFCLVSRSWYSVAISRLYHTPLFTGKNYLPLVSTICPSINAHIRKSELAKLVRRLDMSRLVHDGSKSLTGRLLGRVKDGLEEFVAPQSSFA